MTPFLPRLSLSSPSTQYTIIFFSVSRFSVSRFSDFLSREQHKSKSMRRAERKKKKGSRRREKGKLNLRDFLNRPDIVENETEKFLISVPKAESSEPDETNNTGTSQKFVLLTSSMSIQNLVNRSIATNSQERRVGTNPCYFVSVPMEIWTIRSSFHNVARSLW